MVYDWNKVLMPGTVICSKYTTFAGEEKIGIFVVLYDEQGDNNIFDKNNIVGLKLSTKGTCISNYSVAVDKKLNSFLNEECIACCSKLHTLHKKQQVYKILGKLHPVTYNRIFKVYSKFNNEIMAQLISNI